MYHIHTTIKRYHLSHLILCVLVGLSATLRAATSTHQPNPQKSDSHTLQKCANQVALPQAQAIPITLADLSTTPTYLPPLIAVVTYDYTNQCYYTQFLPDNSAHHFNYNNAGSWQYPPSLGQQSNMVLAQCLSPNTFPTSVMPSFYSDPFSQQSQLTPTNIAPQPFPPTQTYTLPTQVPQPYNQYNKNIIPPTLSVSSTHKPPTLAAHNHHKTATHPRQPASPPDQLLIPANEQCLYTTIIMGYLLPIRQAPDKLTARIDQLFGIQSTYDLKELHQTLQNPTHYLTYLHSDAFSSLVNAFMARMQIKKGTWGGPQEIQTIATKLKVNIQAHYPDPTNPTNLVQADLPKPTKVNSNITIHIVRDKAHPAEVLTQAKKVPAKDNPRYQHYRLKYTLPSPLSAPLLPDIKSFISHKKASPKKSNPSPINHCTVANNTHIESLNNVCQNYSTNNRNNYPSVLWSAKNGLLTYLEYLVQQGMDVNTFAKDGYTALLFSAQKGYLACVKYLVQQGANIHYKNKWDNTAVILSAKKGHLACLKYLHQQGADIESENKNGYTALLFSIENGHLGCFNYLMQQRVNIHVKNKWDNTALLFSAKKGHLHCLKQLLQESADIHHKNENGNTAILLSAEYGHLGCLKYLVQQGASLHTTNKWDNTALLLSAKNGHLGCLKYLLQQNLDIDFKNENGNTVLLYSAENGHLDCLTFLLQKGADIHATNMWDNTSLILSAYNGHIDCVKLLLQKGAYMYHKNENGDTALPLSAKNGHLDCLKHLHQKGAHIYTKNKWKTPPLLLSAYNGHLDCVKYLLLEGAKINTKDIWGNTAVLLSARRGHLDCLKYLHQKGADISAKDVDGKTALHISANQGHLNCLTYLLKQGMDINIKDNECNTALLWSAWAGHLDCLKYLVEQGAYINASDKRGNTALLLSAQNGHLDCVNLLLTSRKACELNLQGADLSQATLPKDLSRANFMDAQLPQDLTNRNLTHTNLTGHHFTSINLDGTQLEDAILTHTLCDYQQCFQDNVIANKQSSSQWYQSNIPKDLKSITQVYPRLFQDHHKAELLQIASGLAYLPYWHDKEFYIKVYYWSCKLFLLKKQLISNLAKKLVCSLEIHPYGLNYEANNYCWHTHYPQHQIQQTKEAPHHEFDQYLKSFRTGLQKYNCQSKYNEGYDWYKNNIEKNIQGLQKNYPQLTNPKPQQEAIDIAFQLSTLYQHQHSDLLMRYLSLQNRLMQFKQSVGRVIGNEVHYDRQYGCIVSDVPPEVGIRTLQRW